MHITFEHETVDHSKQLRPFLYKVQDCRFQFEINIGGKMDCYRNFIYFFRLEKVNQLKTSKTSSSFLLT